MSSTPQKDSGHGSAEGTEPAEFVDLLDVYLRARFPLIAVVTLEEERALAVTATTGTGATASTTLGTKGSVAM